MRIQTLLLFLLPFLLPAQSQQFTAWSLEAGLPQSQVYAMCEDRRGYLWVGTQGGGVCRFDGVDFWTFTTQEGLPSNFISALYEDWEGRLWVGTNEGAAFFDGKQFHRISTEQPLAVYTFLQTDAEHLWLGTTRGIWQYSFKNKQLSKLPLDAALDKTPVYSLLYTEQNRTIWMGTLQGAWYVPQETQRVIHFNKKNKLPVQPVPAMAQVGALLWLAQSNGVLVAVDLATQAVRKTLAKPELENITCLSGDPDGSLWAGTQTAGLFHISPASDSVRLHLTEQEGLPHNHIRVLLRDHAGRRWLGSSGGGFACMGTQAFRRYDRGDGLPGSRIYALHEAPGGDIWLAISQNGLARIDSTGRVQISEADSGYLDGVKCRTLATDEAGNLWVGTERKGVLRISPGALQVFRKDNGFLPSDWVQKISIDAKGVVWAATAEGIASITFNPADSLFVKKWYTTREGLPAGVVSTLQTDMEGNTWFGMANGNIGLIRNGKVEAVFGAEQELPALPVTSIVVDASGRCWVATKGAGIFVKNSGKNDRFTAIQTPQPLSSKNIYLLVLDKFGNLWAGTENGVDQLILEKGKVTAVTHFGKKEGFSGIETCQDAGLCDRNGRLWFGTMNGLMRYIPNTTARQNSPPLLHFEQTALFYKPIEETNYAASAAALFDGAVGGLVLPWHQNHLSFSFKAVELLQEEPLRYRWKLETPDTDWSPWSEQTQVNYANLAPGTYRLLVQASSDEQALSTAISAAFTIQKPFWQEWYFRLGILVLLGALAAWGARAYIQRIRSSEARRREQLEIKNRLLQLEQKALQLQMNPHFIFNAFNSIQSLIATRDYDVARQEINRFAKLMRSILNNSRKTSITLQEEMDTLEQYLLVEQFCQQNPFTFTVQCAEHVDAENLDIPPMLLQPFVENAVVHGVSHLSYPGRIDVFFEIQNEMLLCRITDNGPGREKAALLREAKKPGHQSAALAVTQERLAAIGGSIQLRDRLDGDGKVCGTEVIIEVRSEK